MGTIKVCDLAIGDEKCITMLKNDGAVNMVVSISWIDMNERPRKATRLTVSLEKQDHKQLTEIAIASDASLSWVIRQANRQFIDSTAARPKKKVPSNDARLKGAR